MIIVTYVCMSKQGDRADSDKAVHEESAFLA
jgi:hypothetical protein